MGTRKASIKETGEELSPEEWERFDRAVAEEEAKRPKPQPGDEISKTEPDAAADTGTGPTDQRP